MSEPAFPQIYDRFKDCLPGMSIRDWFATHAPEPPSTWWGGDRPDCAGRAMWNYQYADAMLEARMGAGE
jgi:hypothetical protein